MPRPQFSLRALLLAAIPVGLISSAVAILPGINDLPPHLYADNRQETWLGQGVGAAYGLAYFLLVAIYAFKWWIRSTASPVFWYVLAIACSLPYVWFMVVLDWHNPFIYRVTCWVYEPIAVLAVPSISFALDRIRQKPLGVAWYLARSLIELLIIVPVWCVVWFNVSFFMLGGGWI